MFGYWLGRHVYRPLKGLLPGSVAQVASFIVCGAVHDLVTTAVRGAPALLFTPWFFLVGVGAVLGNVGGMDLPRRPCGLRATVNLAYIAACLAVVLVSAAWLAARPDYERPRTPSSTAHRPNSGCRRVRRRNT